MATDADHTDPAAAAEAAATKHHKEEALVDQQQQPRHTEDRQQQHIEYAMHMRRLFSPPSMLHPDGSINQEFFRPKKVVTITDK